MSLGNALGWKHNHAPGIETRDGVLTSWPVSLGAQPSEAEQAVIVAEFEARQAIVSTIEGLESEVTPRRQREAILGTDLGWLAAQESLIATERAKLT